MTRILAPFKVIDAGVDPGGWMIDFLGERRPMPGFLAEWDCTTQLRIETSVTIAAFDALLDQAGLDASDRIALVITAASSKVIEQQVAEPMLITGDGEIVLGLDLDSTKTGGIVEFRRQIVLLQRSSAGILGARRRGSIIWDDVEPVRLILEADHVRFPAEQVDFSKNGLDRDGLYTLKIEDADLHRLFRGAVRLVLNRTHPLIDAATSGSSEPRSELALSMIKMFTARTLIERALAHPEFSGLAQDYSPATIGGNYVQLLDSAFRNQTVEAVRSLRDLRRDVFDAHLQAAFGPGRGQFK